MTSHERKIVENVTKWMDKAVQMNREGNMYLPRGKITELVANLCNVSVSAVKNIKKDLLKDAEGKKETSSQKKRGGRKSIELDEFNQSLIRRVVLGFYLRRPAEIRTAEKVHKELMDMPGFPKMCCEALRKWLHKLCFSCRRRNRKYKVYESLDVSASRHRYLQEIRK